MAYERIGLTTAYRCARGDGWWVTVSGPEVSESEALNARLEVVIHLLEHSLENVDQGFRPNI
jgi:hypothetical protein